MTISGRQLTGAVVVSFCVGTFITRCGRRFKERLRPHRLRFLLPSNQPTCSCSS